MKRNLFDILSYIIWKDILKDCKIKKRAFIFQTLIQNMVRNKLWTIFKSGFGVEFITKKNI